jgi:hypothetical protein
MSTDSLPSNHFNTIEALANREIARRIIAAMRNGDPQACWCTGERLIATALDDAQLCAKVMQGLRRRSSSGADDLAAGRT